MKGSSKDTLKIAIAITTTILAVEIVGGIISGSLALLSDAGHVFMDVVALSLSLGAIKVAEKPANHRATFGYHRVEIVIALTNGITVFIIAFYILAEAYHRFVNPTPVLGFEMLSVAIVGLAANVYVALKLSGHHDLNVRSAYLHVLGDTLASVSVVVGGVVIVLTGFYIVDPILGGLIGILLLIGAGRLVKESAHILLERPPKHVDLNEVCDNICSLEGVKGIHDVHAWSICSSVHAMSAHLEVDEMDIEKSEKILERVRKMLLEGYNIAHTTFQVECEVCGQEKFEHVGHA